MEACKQCLATLSSFVPINEVAASSAQPPREQGKGGRSEQHSKMAAQAQGMEEAMKTAGAKRSRGTEEKTMDPPPLLATSSGNKQHLTVQEMTKVCHTHTHTYIDTHTQC